MITAGHQRARHPEARARCRARAIASWGALAAAGAWCLALLVAAVVVPVYSGQAVSGSITVGRSGEALSSTVVRSTSATLVEANGTWVLAVVAVPLVPVAIVATSLRRRRRAHRLGAGPVSWTAVGACFAFAFVTGFSIGMFVVPVAVFLTIACATAESTVIEVQRCPPGTSGTLRA